MEIYPKRPRFPFKIRTILEDVRDFIVNGIAGIAFMYVVVAIFSVFNKQQEHDDAGGI